MYRLLPVGLLAQNFLVQRLDKQGYLEIRFTPGFWKHKWIPIALTLVVDNFGVKDVVNQHVKHLIEVLKKHYEI